MDKIFFSSWESIWRTFIVCIFAYVGLIAILRIIGNRTLTQLNAFDFIVNVALGSTLATVMLNKSVALADGLLALAMLVVLQLLISYLSSKVKPFNKMIKSEPRLLFFRGQFVDQMLGKLNISREELFQVVRSQGISDLHRVDAIVLESNGKFSVIKKLEEGTEILRNVTKVGVKTSAPH